MSHPSGRILASLARRFGRNLTLVQAAGGNISVKTSPHRIAIKASGVRLRDMTPAFGWAEADHSFIQKHLRRISRRRSMSAREHAYAKLLQESTRTPHRSISMETGFHAILPGAYVLHLHSIAGILLGLMPEQEARRLIQEVSGREVDAHFVAATLPGFELTYRMMMSLRKTEGERVQLWIQRNHGVVWSGGHKGAILRSIDDFEQGLMSYFQLNRFPPPHSFGSARCSLLPATAGTWNFRGGPGRSIVCFCRWPKCDFDLEPLFPDFVIYFNLWSSGTADVRKTGPRVAEIDASTALQRKDKAEVLYAHALIATLARSRGWYRPLPRPMIGRLKAMESERLRQRQILKA